jgi:hypothetical protein
MLLTLAAFSCKKASPYSPTGDIVGEWAWVHSNTTDSAWTAAGTGIQKTLTFTSVGGVYIAHNDSGSNSTSLLVSPALGTKVVTDTSSYTLTTQTPGCIAPSASFTALTVGATSYAFIVSADSLQIDTAPCASPGSSATYARVKTP